MKIDSNPTSYGSKGQTWHPTFVNYMVEIVSHPSFKGMPDAINSDGKIQWEAPSNRSSGQFQYTHQKRRDWWAAKARTIGISESSDNWISRTAKIIHPSGEKPCKRCGRSMLIAYAYPNSHLVRRAAKLFPPDVQPDPLEEILAFTSRAYSRLGAAFDQKMQLLLGVKGNAPKGVKSWIKWLSEEFIPSEPTILSPGAMSNAPDRFDGFHSFNRCCRGKADTGRHADNLKSYTTDRRVFEYWSDGDWIAADRMMGLIRKEYATHPTADGGSGVATADHIGPLSLGFTHRPEFRLLSKAANSAKNNRMTTWDVAFLIRREREGEQVTSWHAQFLWNQLKQRCKSEEHALRISKIMRDNQRCLMSLLGQLMDEGYYSFLVYLLNLSYADYSVSFQDPYVEDFVVKFQSIRKKARITKYASEQKARRIRIGLQALHAYRGRANRHKAPIDLHKGDKDLRNAMAQLNAAKPQTRCLDRKLAMLLCEGKDGSIDHALRELTSPLAELSDLSAFHRAKADLASGMARLGEILADQWGSDRYVREEFAFDD